MTKSRLMVEPSGTGLASAPIRTPTPLLFEVVSSPLPEIEPCALLLLAMKQVFPCTENVPTGVTTVHGLETKTTWYVPATPDPQDCPHCSVPVIAQVPGIAVVPVFEFLEELQPDRKASKNGIGKTKINTRFIILPRFSFSIPSLVRIELRESR